MPRSVDKDVPPFSSNLYFQLLQFTEGMHNPVVLLHESRVDLSAVADESEQILRSSSS